MTVDAADDGTIVLVGHCPVADAEPLARLLSRQQAGTQGSATVDWRDCEHAHTAVVQILLAVRPMMLGPPRAAPLRHWIEPLLPVRGHDPHTGQRR